MFTKGLKILAIMASVLCVQSAHAATEGAWDFRAVLGLGNSSISNGLPQNTYTNTGATTATTTSTATLSSANAGSVYEAGGYATYFVSPNLGLRTGLLYAQRYASYTTSSFVSSGGVSVLSPNGAATAVNLTLNFIDIPFEVVYNLGDYFAFYVGFTERNLTSNTYQTCVGASCTTSTVGGLSTSAIAPQVGGEVTYNHILVGVNYEPNYSLILNPNSLQVSTWSGRLGYQF